MPSQLNTLVMEVLVEASACDVRASPNDLTASDHDRAVLPRARVDEVPRSLATFGLSSLATLPLALSGSTTAHIYAIASNGAMLSDLDGAGLRSDRRKS